MGLVLLGEFDLYELISLVQNQDYKELTRAKGVGPKLAQKIILELKGKLMKVNVPVEKNCACQIPAEYAEVLSILQSLGYEDCEIKDAFKKMAVAASAPQEEILRAALTILSM
jgi:Holliday junction DNA helicase RuvA